MNKLYTNWILKLLFQIQIKNRTSTHNRLIYRLSEDLQLNYEDWNNSYEFVASVLLELDYNQNGQFYVESSHNMCLATCVAIKAHLNIPFNPCAAPVLFSEEGVKWRYAEN